MWPYWILFLIPAAAALVERSRQGLPGGGYPSGRWNGATFCAALAITLMIGYRFEVGGDWGAYQKQFQEIEGRPLDEILGVTDPGYVLLNWISDNLDLGIWGVNLVCGALFSTGLLRFCRSLPRPWLALTVAVPYLLIVVAMGYSRQGVALGCAMLGMVSLKNRSPLWFVIWVILGATFHKSAVLMLPIAALAASKNRYWSVALAIATTYFGYVLLVQDAFDELYANYVEADIQSEGAMIRLMMNAVPALILLLYGKRFQFDPAERSLWRGFAMLSLALLGGIFVSNASTAIDRMALYMLPLQVVVFAHLPNVLGRTRGRNLGVVSAVVAYYAVVQFTWLNFANYSTYWQPYRFYPLEGL